MSIARICAKWCVPPGFYPFLRRFVRIDKDVNVTISPNDIHHIRRYEFAQARRRGSTILDAACGSGYGSDLLEEHTDYTDYVGVDYADYCIQYAKRYYAKESRRFVQADIRSLDQVFAPKSFDTIISFETLEHLEAPKVALAVFLQLLKPGGTLITSMPLNHPDLVFHKRRYTHREVRDLFSQLRADVGPFYDFQEYLQTGLQITPVSAELPDDQGGVWLGVLSTETSASSRSATAERL